ncbi:hypothetical protein NM208_g7968 [Fusarium decemcellulare]|uniref:Uncharacterized protein n=1 Tax=Fusarium decemcellulare TaxID=57161 RepID=A0ACC1S720_9HYPO|nr:hypothetical protein NM208_g7968 [Fusarium decemcellulare]
MATSADRESADIDGQDGVEVEPQMSISAGLWNGSIGKPFHESLTLSALISSKSGVPPGTTLKSASNEDWEYIRGAVWNDDPACQLFADTPDANHSYTLGFDWARLFKTAEKAWNPNDLSPTRLKNVTGRSHYGDLQFLHCMASDYDEDPAVTKANIMVWMEVMYKLATGEDDKVTPATEVSKTPLAKFCPNHSLPPSWYSLSYWLAPDSKFKGLDIGRRALGSMFHIIQDSYAVGHTRRELLNPGDKISDDPLKFKDGVADQWGPIKTFHTYYGQDSDSHKHYDHFSDDIPDPGHLDNLEQWNSMIGCRDAVEKCKVLAEKKLEGKRWEGKGGVEEFLDTEVFGHSFRAHFISDINQPVLHRRATSRRFNLPPSQTTTLLSANMSTIQLNGNALNLEKLSDDVPKDARNTNFILVQGYRDLSPGEKQKLEDNKVKILEYVSRHTYLCRYEPTDLSLIRSMGAVENVSVYVPDAKTTTSLKAIIERDDQKMHYTVDCILHQSPNVNATELAPFIAEKAKVDVQDLQISPSIIRVTVHQDRIPEIAKLDSISRIEEVRQVAVLNNEARGTLNVDLLTLSTSYEGVGQRICVADTGFDLGRTKSEPGAEVHPAFTGRVECLDSVWLDTYKKGELAPERYMDEKGHGTHVCASICGSGVYKSVDTEQGAVTVRLFKKPYDLGIRIHNNSWGKAWDDKTGQLGYETQANAIDGFVYGHQDFIVLVAAGNNGDKTKEKSQIGAAAAAKNCITVGSTGSTRQNDRQNFVKITELEDPGTQINETAVFSSRGPTLRKSPCIKQSGSEEPAVGRIKPDIVAPGVAVLSAASRGRNEAARRGIMWRVSEDDDWVYGSGTSMSTPLVAGCVALLREALEEHGKKHPSAALIKALLVNGAVNYSESLGLGVGYDYEQGFGRVDVDSSIAMIRQSSFIEGGSILETTQFDVSALRQLPESQRKWFSPEIPVPSGRNRLIVTLAYPDPASIFGELQNDINLIVRSAGAERHGNMGKGRNCDHTNNVEKVIWENVPGKTFKIVVSVYSNLKPKDPAAFAVAWDIRPLARLSDVGSYLMLALNGYIWQGFIAVMLT